MKIIEYKDNDTLLARFIPSAIVWNNDLNFFSKDDEFIQAGSWIYQQGKKLLPHTHNKVKREVNLTQEVIYVKKGKIIASIYDLNEKRIAEVDVNEGDIIILLNGGHGYEIAEDETQVLEIKNGPYLGADIDRRRF